MPQPNRGLNSLDLAKERADAAELKMSPMLKQPSGFGGHLPLTGIRPGPPLIHMTTDLVDDRRRIVFLSACRKVFGLSVAQIKLFLLGRLSLLRLRNRRDEFSPTTSIKYPLSRLPLLIQFPMPLRAIVRRVKNWMLKERIRHGGHSSKCATRFVAALLRDHMLNSDSLAVY